MLAAFDVFRRFLGLLGADTGNCGDSDGDLKSAGHMPGPGILYGAMPRLCVIVTGVSRGKSHTDCTHNLSLSLLKYFPESFGGEFCF